MQSPTTIATMTTSTMTPEIIAVLIVPEVTSAVASESRQQMKRRQSSDECSFILITNAYKTVKKRTLLYIGNEEA